MSNAILYTLRIVVLLSLFFVLSSCGGGGGDGGGGGGNPLSNLAGTWFGTLEDPNGVLDTISVTIDGSGNLTQILVGGVDTGTTGTITETSPGIFSIVFSDFREGGFIVDPGFNHAGFLIDDFNFGVVQKGASALPGYIATDIVGSWSGTGVTLDGNFDIVTTFTSNATVASTTSISGSDSLGGSFSGTFASFNITFGRWVGSYTDDSGGGSGTFEPFLSVDKAFAASWACDTRDGSVIVGFPGDCSFSFWSKQ